MKKAPLDRRNVSAAGSEENHFRLNLAFHAMGGGIWDYDVANDQLVCDERWYNIIGLPPLTHPIVSLNDFKPFIHPDDVTRATQIDLTRLNELLARRECYAEEFRIVRPDGAMRWVRSVASLIGNEDGNIRAVGCITDITDFRLPPPGMPANDTGSSGASPSAPNLLKRLDSPPPILLSDRERECLLWVSLGKTAWETAMILGLSQRTIEFHLHNAIAKLGATNKVHAAVTAIRMGLL